MRGMLSLVRVDTAGGAFRIDSGFQRANSPVALLGDVLYANYGAGLQGLNLPGMQYEDTLFAGDYTAAAFNQSTGKFAIQESDYFSFETSLPWIRSMPEIIRTFQRIYQEQPWI
ncbi:MAG: hypothetical protein R3B47_19175 [Bacteroidia bacterium]